MLGLLLLPAFVLQLCLQLRALLLVPPALLLSLTVLFRIFLASFLPRLNDAGRKTVITGLTGVAQNNAVEDDVAGRYAEFVSALTDKGKATEEVRGHLGQVARQVAALVIDRSLAPQYGGNPRAVVPRVENYVSKVLPAIAPAISHAPTDDTAAMLNHVFSEGLYIDHARPLFAKLHRAMVGHWPASDEVPYDPETVFDRAEEAALANPEIVGAPTLLHSMASVVEANGLGVDHRRRVLDAACALWPHRQEFALKTITSHDEPPSPGPVASLGLWLRTVPDPAPMRNYSSRTRRPWTRTSSGSGSVHSGTPERLGPPFFRTELPRLFGHEEIERTVSAVRSGKDRVTNLFDGPGARNELGRGLLEAFVASPRNSDKGFLAQWIKDAGAAGSLGHLNDLTPTEEDLDILEGVFADKKLFQKYRSSRSPRGRGSSSDHG